MNTIKRQTALARRVLTQLTPEDMRIIGLWLDDFPDSTKRVYMHALAALLADVGFKSLRSISLDDLQAHRSNMVRSGLADGTRAKRLAAIKSLFSFASGKGGTAYLLLNPAAAIRLPKAPDRLAERILDEATIRAIIGAEIKPNRRLLLFLYYASGGRISEVVNLRWEECHAHTEGGVVTLSKTKGGRARTIKLPPAVWDYLMAFRGEAKGYVFPSPRWQDYPIVTTTAWRWFKAASRLADVEASPHWFRHAHASHSLDHGAPIHLVARTLGHRSIATTTRYAHARPGESSGDYLVMPELPELPEAED